MPRLPWDPTLPGDPASLARRARLPAGTRLSRLGEGWDNFACLGPRGALYRFSKRPGEFAVLRREARLLRFLDGRLPLAIPRVLREGRGFMAYRPLPGRFLADLEPTASTVRAVAPAIGAFASALHAIDSKGLRLPLVIGTPAGQRRETAGYQRRLLRHGVILRGVGRILERAPGPFRGPPVLVHNDLLQEHILVRRGRPSGVIDWADAGLGDPAADFAGLAMWGGMPAVEGALREYAGPVDAGLRDRARFFGICVGVSEIHYGVFGGRPECVKWGRRALRALLRG